MLERGGIPVKVLALHPTRPNLVARLNGDERKRPRLLMVHMDVVNVDPRNWNFPPFSATRAGGYNYGRNYTGPTGKIARKLE